jgi:hypothetical protein
MPRSAFTLIELLISVSVGMLLLAMAWTGFRQTLAYTARARARVELHNSARFVYERLQANFSGVEPSCAAYLHVEAPTADTDPDPHDGRITFLFGGSIVDERDFRIGSGAGPDVLWRALRWSRPKPGLDPATGLPVVRPGVLAIAQSTFPSRSANPGVAWGTGSINNANMAMRYMPQPMRSFTPVTTEAELTRIDPPDRNWLYPIIDLGTMRSTRDLGVLDVLTSWRIRDKSTGVPAASDFGNWTDLSRNLVAVNDRVSTFTMQLVAYDDASAPVLTIADPAGPSFERFWDGVAMDGRPVFVYAPPGPNTGSAVQDRLLETTHPWKDRPQLVRIAFTLLDPPSGTSVPFSFTFAWPGVRP